jgi:hypothetical protein
MDIRSSLLNVVVPCKLDVVMNAGRRLGEVVTNYLTLTPVRQTLKLLLTLKALNVALGGGQQMLKLKH